jgi:hypothetical protein
MVYLGAIRYRQLRVKLKEAKGKAELLRSIQQSAETFTLTTITCLRATIDNSWAAILSNNEDLIQEADEDLTLLTSIVDVLLSSESEISPHIWAPRFQITAVLPAAVDLFSRSPMQGQQLNGQQVVPSGVTPTYSEALLSFFFTLSSHGNTAELLTLSGIINGLCNNSLSSLLDPDQDSLQDWISPGLANTSFENPSHVCWIQMIRIVVALIANLDDAQSQRFIQTEAWTFFKVYEKRLNHSLGVRLRVKAGLMQTRRSTAEHQMESIRMNQLEEVELVLQLYLHIVRAKSRHMQPAEEAMMEDNGEGKDLHLLFEGYTSQASVQLQEFVHLLQHPRELTALIGGRESNEVEKRVKRLLISACTSIVTTLWEIGRGGQVLCMEPTDWDLRQTIILPTISTTPTSLSSTGTLLDFTSCLVEGVMQAKRVEAEKDQLPFLLTALETTAALCTTQLVLAAYTRPNAYSATIRKDLETGLGRDVKQGLESARGAVQAAASGQTAFFDIILGFHDRWLQGSND